jgi:hypothetical protein
MEVLSLFSNQVLSYCFQQQAMPLSFYGNPGWPGEGRIPCKLAVTKYWTRLVQVRTAA